MRRWTGILLLFAALAALCPVDARAQEPVRLRRSPKSIVRGGIAPKTDSLGIAAVIDSLAGIDSLLLSAAEGADSLATSAAGRLSPSADSLGIFAPADSLGARFAADSLLAASPVDPEQLDSLRALPSVDEQGKRRRMQWLMKDSMSLSRVCWTSAILPGYGQIYNKQYWKLPILYGTLGTGLGLFIHENGKYKPLKREFDEMTALSTDRTPELDALQARMIRSNTRRQLYLGATIASYVFFLGDAAVNYATNDVSRVKKATTLACICPGAGQIYNKSYWKVPFVVGGFATTIYCIDWNNRGYQRFKKAYALRAAYDSDPDAYPNGSPDEFGGRYSASYLKNLKDNFRRNRDLCIIITAGLYILQIVDAHVDAHFKDYDISDDLSMNLEPLVEYNYVPAAGGNRPMFGFNMSFKF